MSALSDSLSDWAWEGVVFPASETSVEWGHDSARHQGYRQRGADVETTGQKPRAVTVTIPLRNGIRWTGPERLYPETYLHLREALKTPEGYLTHPTYGLMTAHVDSVRERIDPMRPDGLDLEVTFTEQRAESQELELTLARSASPADAALSSAQQVDAEGAAVDGRADTTSLAAAITEAFDYLDSAQRSSTEVASSLGELVADVESRLSDPAGMVSTAFEYRSALSRTRAALLDRRAQYLGSDAALTVTIAEDMSLARAAVVAYGDASKASQLAGRNRIDDPTLIPAGTVLVL